MTEVKKPFTPVAGQNVRVKGDLLPIALVYAESYPHDNGKDTVYTVQVKSGDIYDVVAGSNFWQVIK